VRTAETMTASGMGVSPKTHFWLVAGKKQIVQAEGRRGKR